MNGFSTKRFFDTEQLKKGMLLTATFKDGAVKSGLISNVTPEQVQFTYWDTEKDSFQEENVTIEQVENGAVVVNFSAHLTDFIATEEKKQKEEPKQGPKHKPFSHESLDEMLKKNFSQEVMEKFVSKYQDGAVIAFILSRLSLSPNDFAKLLFTLPDTLSLNVHKEMDALKSLDSESMKSLEEKVTMLVRDFIRNLSQEKPHNPFSFGGGPNPLGDMFGDLFGDILNKNPGKPNGKIEDITSQFEEMFRKFFDDKNKPF